jgi:hypothetical protein
MKITYHNAGNAPETKTFKDVEEFLMLQNREIPAIQDHYQVDELYVGMNKLILLGQLAICLTNITNKSCQISPKTVYN